MIMVLAKAIPNDEEAKAKVIEFAQDLIEKSKAEETRLPNEKEKAEGKYNKNIKVKKINLSLILNIRS